MVPKFLMCGNDIKLWLPFFIFNVHVWNAAFSPFLDFFSLFPDFLHLEIPLTLTAQVLFPFVGVAKKSLFEGDSEETVMKVGKNDLCFKGSSDII